MCLMRFTPSCCDEFKYGDDMLAWLTGVDQMARDRLGMLQFVGSCCPRISFHHSLSACLFSMYVERSE